MTATFASLLISARVMFRPATIRGTKSGKYSDVTPLSEALTTALWPARRKSPQPPPMFMGRLEAIPTAATPVVAASRRSKLK